MKSPHLTITLPICGRNNFLLPCLRSIENLDYPQESLEIILVDNGLNPQLKKIILDEFPKIEWLGEGKNLGFAKAVNLGIGKAIGDWIFVTNLDVLLDKDCLSKMIKVGEMDPTIGILGPLVYSYKKVSQVPQISSQDLPGAGTNLFWGLPKSLTIRELEKLKEPIGVDWISGSGMMVRKKVFEKIGLLDERFFVYWEDADLGVRAKKAGFKVVLVPKAKIYHHGSAVLGQSSEHTYYLVRNSFLFLFKHISLTGKVILHLRNTVSVAVKTFKVVLGIERQENLAFLVGIFDFYRGRFGERR